MQHTTHCRTLEKEFTEMEKHLPELRATSMVSEAIKKKYETHVCDLAKSIKKSRLYQKFLIYALNTHEFKRRLQKKETNEARSSYEENLAAAQTSHTKLSEVSDEEMSEFAETPEELRSDACRGLHDLETDEDMPFAQNEGGYLTFCDYQKRAFEVRVLILSEVSLN